MYQGEIVEEGKVKDVFDNPKHSYTRNLIQSLPEFKLEERKLNKKDDNKQTKVDDNEIILKIENLFKEFPV